MFRYPFNYLSFLQDYIRFKNSSKQSPPRFSINFKDRYPSLYDKTKFTGFDRHYIYHLAWASRVLSKISPEIHYDISSSVYFCTIVSAFVPMKYYDYRPADITLSDLSSESADLLALPFKDGSIKSLSCMHTVEHVGLGRYGDRLDPEGDIKAIRELIRVLAKDGYLLFVVPIGKPKIIFNAHRIYSYDQIINYFSELKLEEFSLIPDNPVDGGMIRNASIQIANAQSYGCGCFLFRK